jgi:hypothetical protein
MSPNARASVVCAFKFNKLRLDERSSFMKRDALDRRPADRERDLSEAASLIELGDVQLGPGLINSALKLR